MSLDWLAPLKELKDILLSPVLLVGLGLAGLLILFLPDNMANWFGLESFRSTYRAWVGLATLCFLILGILQILVHNIWPLFHQKVQTNANAKEFLESIETLSSFEVFVLGYCLERNLRTIYIVEYGRDPIEKTVEVLCDRGVFDYGVEIMGWRSYIIPPDKWRLLQRKKDNLLNQIRVVDPNFEKGFEQIDAYQKQLGQ